MKTNRPLFIFIISILGIIAPLSYINAVNTHHQGKEIKEIKKEPTEEKKMDGLSLAAHIATTAGIASLFLLPELALILLPAGFVMGIIAWTERNRRYEHKKGKGLALAAMIFGGAFAGLIMVAFLAYILSYG